MRILIAIVVVAALGWSGYWFWGANRVDEAVGAALADLKNSGWTVETDGWRVRGFPNRFDTFIDAPRATAPEDAYTWSAPFLQVMALSYRPNQLIVAFADRQEIAGPWGTATLETDSARASLTVRPEETAPLDHANLVVAAPRVETGDRVWNAAELLLASRLPEGDPSGRVHVIGMTLDDLDLPEGLVEGLPTDAARIDGARLDLTLTLAEPLHLADQETVDVETIRIDGLNVTWGEIGLSGDGTLSAGPEGFAEGEIDLDLRNWRAALELAGEVGLVADDSLDAIAGAMGFLTGGGDRLSLPLAFRDGRTFLGPVPVGAAPRLR